MAVADTLPLPWCETCGNGKLVEYMVVEEDRFTRTFTAIVRCHGAEESMPLTHAQIEDASAITRGVAFRTPKLLSEPTELEKQDAPEPPT